PAEARQAGPVTDDGDRQEDERAQREGGQRDGEGMHVLEQGAEVHVAPGGQADEDDRQQESGGLAVRGHHRHPGIRSRVANGWKGLHDFFALQGFDVRLGIPQLAQHLVLVTVAFSSSALQATRFFERSCGVLKRASSMSGLTSSASHSRRYMCWPEAAMFM